MKGSVLGLNVVGILCDDKPVGGGFFLDNQHILTCAHIIDKIQRIKSSDEIMLQPMWPDNKKIITAKVLISLSDKNLGNNVEKDIAILKLDEEFNIGKRIPLILVNELAGHNFCSFGYPEGHKEGIYTQGKIRYEHPNKRIIIENHKNSKIILQEGFSGCPVWDKSIKGIVGIITQTEKNKNWGTFIPTKSLLESLRIVWAEINNFVYEYTFQGSGDINFCEEMMEILDSHDDEHNLFQSLKKISKKRLDLLNSGALIEDDLKKLNYLSRKIIEKWRGFRETYDRQNYKYIFNFPAYDDFHSINIECLMYDLVPKLFDSSWVKENNTILFGNNISFTFLLLASAWFHDIGMITSLLEDKPSDNKKEIENQYLNILDEHHERSIEYLSNNSSLFKLTDGEINYLADICKLHVHKDYSRLHELNKTFKRRGQRNDVNIPLITSYLRLADTLQIPRKTKDVKSYMALGLDDSFAKFQWLKSQITAYPIIDSERFKVIIDLKIPENIYETIKRDNKNNEDKKLEDSVNNLRQSIEIEIQNEIDCIKDIVVDGKINFYLNAECKIVKCPRHKCIEKDFKELLNDIELFGPRMSPNASAVIGVVLKQIDSILSGKDEKTNLENLRDYNNTVLQSIKNKRPCHVFLHKVANFLTESIPESEEDVENAHKVIKKKLKSWNQKINYIKRALPNIAYGIFSDSKSSLLLYGYSSSIINCLEVAIKKNDGVRNIEIYVCEAATKNELRYNNRIVYSDGLRYIHELKRLKIKKIYYITDACPSHIFSEESGSKISKVLFGANGIEPDGSIHHTLGHLAIAEMAHKHGVWVFVIADTLKIGGIDKSKLGGFRGNEWCTTDIDKEDILKSNENTNVINYNPRGDKVSAELISAIILETGIIKPEDTYKYMDTS